MTLGNVVTGRRALPPRLVLYGTEGIGKSTFAAGAESPIFLGAEDGTSELDVARFPQPENFTDVLEAVRVLGEGGHKFRTLVIDSLDWVEPLLWNHLCAAAKVDSIEKVGGGYGKGYTAALEHWVQLLNAIDRMRHTAGVGVIAIAHAHSKTFQNPEGGDYDKYSLKLNDKAAGKIREWCDAVLYAQHEVFTSEVPGGRKSKAIGSGKRLLHTEERAAYFAKNRYGLPATMPLSWPDFADAMAARSPDAVRARITALLEECDDAELKAKVTGHVATLGDDIQRLCEAENRLKGRVGQ